MENVKHSVQFCVIGGGLAGICAAIAAARHGVKTLLMHERPVFGGNASSEIRMWVCGTPHCLETGLIEEIRLENLHRNTCPNYSVWDSILYEKVRFQENLTSLLNCSCLDAKCENNRILSVTGYQQTTQKFHTVNADYFADCSGDSILALLAGAEFRIGREAKSEFGESLARECADCKTMGLSCLIQARETDAPQKFTPPGWANFYLDDDSFPKRGHELNHVQNFWWLELGGNRNSIGDTEEIRDDLLKSAFGIWDHIKNHGDHGAENWVLDWVGFLPGKRESRRCMGDYILSEKDILSGARFDDAVAYGGWPVDDHHPDGFLHSGTPNISISVPRPYHIPLRTLYSKNVENLLFAGRNISASHAALSSSRVMATCAIMGQAIGVTAKYAVSGGMPTLRETRRTYFREIQRTLMDDDCYLPGFSREVPRLSLMAELTASSGTSESLRDGNDRELDGNSHAWCCRNGDWAEYRFQAECSLSEIRIVFDSDLFRPHLNMISNYTLNGELYESPATLVKGFHLESDGREFFRMTENYQRLIRIPFRGKAQKLRLCIDELRPGSESTRIFAFDIR